MSADFLDRFKGKAQTMDRNGPTAIVENSYKPIRPLTQGQNIPVSHLQSQTTRMDVNAIQRNYLNFSNEYKQAADMHQYMHPVPPYMQMAPMFMPQVYDVAQLNYQISQGYYPPSYSIGQQVVGHIGTMPNMEQQVDDVEARFNVTETRMDEENTFNKSNRQRHSAYNYEDYKRLKNTDYNFGGLGANYSESWQKK